jgi:hypothetical protein
MKRSRAFQLAVIIALLPCQAAFAQLTDIDTLQWQYRLSATGSLLTGNVERLLLISGGELAHVQKILGFKTGNTFQYGTIRKRQTEDDLVSRNFVYLFPKARFYPYLMAWFEKNLRKKIAFRRQLGLGVSYTLSLSATHRMKASLTLSRETTDFAGKITPNASPESGETITTYRATLRFIGKHALLQSKLRIAYEIWYQPSLRDDKNYRHHFDGAMEWPVSKKIALRAAVNRTHESVVLPAVKKSDLLFTFGITFGNY